MNGKSVPEKMARNNRIYGDARKKTKKAWRGMYGTSGIKTTGSEREVFRSNERVYAYKIVYDEWINSVTPPEWRKPEFPHPRDTTETGSEPDMADIHAHNPLSKTSDLNTML